MSVYVIPLYILIVLLTSLFSGNDVYEHFIEGCKDGCKTVLKIFPHFLAMYTASTIFVKSGVLDVLTNFISTEKALLIIQGLLRPISGNGSLLVMKNIFDYTGVDSITSITSSILQGSTDTTLYIVTLYFSTVGIKKYRYALLIGFTVDLIAFFSALLVVNLL